MKTCETRGAWPNLFEARRLWRDEFMRLNAADTAWGPGGWGLVDGPWAGGHKAQPSRGGMELCFFFLGGGFFPHVVGIFMDLFGLPDHWTSSVLWLKQLGFAEWDP